VLSAQRVDFLFSIDQIGYNTNKKYTARRYFMDYLEFLKSDILCLLYDYGEMTAEEINSMLGSTQEEVEFALFELLLEEKVRGGGEEKYAAVDEVNVKRLKKSQPSIF
jgi:hypothetical protein